MNNDVEILLTNIKPHSSTEMDSAAVEPEATDVQSPVHEHNDVFDDEAKRKKPGIRKRTKTGCLTCRKRRIKCDEGRPICNNCTKSKRHCDGYNQRVIFKDPLGAFRGGTFGPVVFPTESPQYSFFSTTASGAQSKSSSQVPQLAFIAPKPPPQLDLQGSFLGTYCPPFPCQPGPSAPTLDSTQLELCGPHIFFPTNPWDQQGKSHSTCLAGPPNDEKRVDYENEQPFVRQKPGSFLDLARFEPPKERLQPEQLYSLADDGVDHSDDDLYLVDSEDEFERAQLTNSYGNGAKSHNFSPFAGCSTGVRPFSACTHHNVLTSYVPCAANSPLNDSKTADIFWHFVNVTGPSMSLYERHPSQACSRREFAQSGYNAKHNIWTYNFPVVAFHHPALLQAILAIGSLQIAKLRDEPATSALKHYHLAIRRVAQYVRSHARRTQPATVASTLLLAFFEVWNSDHAKWSQHLYGARLLFKEIPFREMTRSLLPIKRAKRALFGEKLRQSEDQLYLGFTRSQYPEDDLDNLDLECLSHLTGQNIRYENDEQPSGLWHTDGDIEQYERLRDLYWWYSKMDVYQGLLSGGRPFMEFEHWTQCPPRAPMGRLDAVYGTYDHLVLVMARLMTFAAKDLSRKRKYTYSHKSRGAPCSASTDGAKNVQPRDWHHEPPDGLTAHQRIPPSMSSNMMLGILPEEPAIGRTPGSIVSDVMSHPGLAPGATSSIMPSGGYPSVLRPDMMHGGPPSDSPLMFPGMLPTTGEVTLPMGFSPPQGASASGGRHEDVELEMTTAEAMREWESIRAAFELLRASFGPGFDPIHGDYEEEDLQKSPFGSTLRYRTFSVAGIWLNYYMGLIHLYRAHPKMPPAAMIAQGIQARHTWQYAREIGRISAGLAGDLSKATEISTLMGAALVECALPLFVGAIQYQEDYQRHWVIKRLHDVARLTGWQSARQIADGCETAWIKAAELGKGPPYVRDPMLEKEMPRSLWAMPRKIHSELEQMDSSDKVLIVARSDRAAYALGLLTAQHELDRLQLEDG